jgi:two-component system sensor kinase FixL
MAILAVDVAGVVRCANATAERFFGGDVSAARVAVADLVEGLDLVGDAGEEAVDQFNRRSRGIGGDGGRMMARRLSGEAVPVDVQAARFTAVGESFVTLFIQDVSAVISAEAAVQELRNEITHNWRLNSLGEMASILAHELNQPLSAITNYLHATRSLLGGASPDTGQAITALLAAEVQARRAGDTIRRIRALMARETGYHANEEMLAVVEDLMPILRISAREFGANISVDVKALETAHCDRVQIQQVLANLVRNGMEAAPKDGIRHIVIRGRSNPEDGSYILSVEDDGPGIAPDVADRLFEPLASTKKNGMGLGLSICKTIVEAHGGAMSCAKAPLGGAAFSFTIKSDRQATA